MVLRVFKGVTNYLRIYGIGDIRYLNFKVNKIYSIHIQGEEKKIQSYRYSTERKSRCPIKNRAVFFCPMFQIDNCQIS